MDVANTKTLRPTTEDIVYAAGLIRQGALVAFPTDTVYGLGASISCLSAIEALYEVKQRPRSKPLSILCTRREQVEQIACTDVPFFDTWASRFWPGALTLILPKRDSVHPLITGGGHTVGVRIPAHQVACELIDRVGEPLAVPSANRSGQPSAVSAPEVLCDLEGKIAAVIDGGVSSSRLASTVIDLTGTKPQRVRQGTLNLSDISVK